MRLHQERVGFSDSKRRSKKASEPWMPATSGSPFGRSVLNSISFGEAETHLPRLAKLLLKKHVQNLTTEHVFTPQVACLPSNQPR